MRTPTRSGGRRARTALVTTLALVATACASDSGGLGAADPRPSTTHATSTSDPPASSTSTSTTTTSTTTTSTTTTSTTTTTTSTTTTTTSTTLPPFPPAVPAAPPADPAFAATNGAFDRLAASNVGASLTVARGGVIALERASGPTIDGLPATAATPMIVASVSKMMTSAAVARLADDGLVPLDDPVPWEQMGLPVHPVWLDVTIRELLDHTAGMPVARADWFRGPPTCREFLPALLAAPPTAQRGEWRYSNGNYCALGLVLEHATGSTAVEAVNAEVFAPLDLIGAHSTVGGLLPGDMVHPDNPARLDRLGAAGTFVVSTNDLAVAFSHLSPADLSVLRQPAVFTDQYGIGHTGTIDGAKACTWILEDGATVMSATISGNSVGTGGDVCDLLLPALAVDLGLPSTEPDRWP